jgi:hypothetical protein
MCSYRFRDVGFGYRVFVSGFGRLKSRVQGHEAKVKGLGFRVLGSRV